jgi:hypothetical protein
LTTSAWQLKRRVGLVIGSMAREVEIVNQGDSLLVKIKVDSPVIQRMVMSRLAAMPELASPNVHSKVEVGYGK